MNLGIFSTIIMLHQGTATGERIEDYTGLAKSHPVLALLTLIFLLSLAGIPPTARFFAKFYIFVALIEQGHFALAITAVLFSAVATFFYIRIVMLMYMRQPLGEFSIQLNFPLRVALTTTGIAVIGIGL